MKAMTAKSSLELGVVHPPLLSLVNSTLMDILLNLNEVRALCLRELGSLVDDVVLFLASLTTTHREAGLPTSTAQRGGLCEVGARGGILGLGSGNPFPTKHARCDRRLCTF
jgi:hypothetical protein